MPFFTHQETVTTTAAPIIKFNKHRKAYRIYNDSNADVIIGPDREVTATTGHIIPTNQSEQYRKALGEDVTMEVYAIVAADSKVVTIREELE